MTDRQILRVSGADRVKFLQGLVTNDVTTASATTMVYAAILTPQGKYLCDFLIFADDDALFLDVAHSHAAPLAQRLSMYRLRADVEIAPCDIRVSTGATGLVDPRHPDLPLRTYGDRAHSPDPIETRIAHVIPQTGIELTPDTYILEAGFERLNGVDFRKGCYVGQEVTARMKHKTDLKKGLIALNISGAAPIGTAIMADGKEAGHVYSQHGGRALAHMRFARMAEVMQAGDATLHPIV